MILPKFIPGLLLFLLSTGTGHCADATTIAALDKICKAEGGLHSKGPVRVDGFYLPGRNYLNTMALIAKALGDLRFHYIELDSSTLGQKLRNTLQATDPEENPRKRYIRFSVAKTGDPRCKAYQQDLAGNSKNNTIILQHRKNGLYPDACIAVERTNTLSSDYMVRMYTTKDRKRADTLWRYNEIRQIKTNKVQSQYRALIRCWNGIVDGRFCLGKEKKDMYGCPAKGRLQYGFLHDVLAGESLLPTENPLLAPKLEQVTVKNTVKPTVTEVRPEIIAVVEGKDKITALTGEQFRDLYTPRDAEELAWVSTKKSPTLMIIDENRRKLFSTTINLGQTSQDHDYSFSCMQAIADKGIFFLAWSGRRQPVEHPETFYILHYSWQGQLKTITRGRLPIDFHPQGDPHHYYANLLIHKDHYRLSVLEQDGHLGGRNSVKASKEYRLKIPFT